MVHDGRYFESKNCRCFEYKQNISTDFYMTICGIEQNTPGKKFGPIIRDGYHVHVVFSGKGHLEIGEKTYEVHAGQIFVTVPEKETYYKADKEDPWYYCWITFAGDKAHEYVKCAGFGDGCYVRDCNIDTGEFMKILQKILAHPKLNQSSETYRLAMAYQYMSMIQASVEASQKEYRGENDLSTDDYIEYAIKYIQGNYARVKIGDLADYIGINRTYLATIFKRKLCMSPQEYLMRVRMNKATELLCQTELQINQVASNVGYDNALTFSKMFKKEYGISPEAYRKKALER